MLTVSLFPRQAKEGFFCTIRLAAKVDLPPQKVFAILARPDSRNVFRSIDVRAGPSHLSSP